MRAGLHAQVPQVRDESRGGPCQVGVGHHFGVRCVQRGAEGVNGQGAQDGAQGLRGIFTGGGLAAGWGAWGAENQSACRGGAA
ncbi:hypothetical protein DEGR_11830 [Deinococcus grandis]|nr:hypothetical protein DEGR_11830 [Deinococcus grandis]